MLIKWGALVTDGRGKLGGHVASKNRGGNYLRTNVVPSNPQTDHQQAGRARLGGLSQEWSGLNAEQIQAWNAAVQDFPRKNIFGDTKLLNGKNLFVGLNYMRLLTDQGVMNNPPAPGEISIPTDLSVAQIDTAGSSPKWELTLSLNEQAENVVIEATAPLTPGTGYFKNRFRVIDTTTNQSSGTVDVYDAYVERFGVPPTGKRVAFRFYTVNSAGQKSPGIQESIVLS